jgi:hypothetical protein
MVDLKNADGSTRELSSDMDKKRKAAFEAISKKAMLINLERKQLANYVFDVQFSEKVRDKFGIESVGMLQVRKCIINPQHFANVRSIINDAMLMLWNHTRPWDNIGFRLLPMDLYDDFNDVFTKIKDEFEEAVQVIVDNWDEYVTEAKTLLGKAFNQSDYPSSTDIKDMFELSITTHQLPDIDDVRLNLSGEELLDLEDEIKEKYNLDMSHARIMLKGTIKMVTDLMETAEDKTPFAKAAHKGVEVLAKLNLDATDPEIAAFLETTKIAISEHYEEDSTKEAADVGSGLLIDDEDDLPDVEAKDSDDVIPEIDTDDAIAGLKEYGV